MSLRRTLTALDPQRVTDAFDGAFDKCTSFTETGVMVDRLGNGFPALAGLLDRLQSRLGDEVDDEGARTNIVLGAALVLLTLVEVAQVEDLRLRFPDASV